MKKNILLLFILFIFVTVSASGITVNKAKKMDKSYYIELMEKVLAAYSNEHIIKYYNDVKSDGLKEHGYPRLTANIGILIAHGRRLDLKEQFVKMMDLCCREFLKVQHGKKTFVGNDFSVKEVIFCIQELEKSKVFDAEKTAEWRKLLSQIDPYSCYNVYAVKSEDIVYNWAAFTMLSEFIRQKAGLADKYGDFIDLQAFSQIRFLDENMMYCEPGAPMVYDFVTRGLYALLLSEGYQGKYKKFWENALDKSASATLKMPSVTGEMPYGGRSNQFLHNEAHVAVMLEYYAKRFAQKGDMHTAGQFKAKAQRALQNISGWLSKKKISHIKNSFPVSSQYGCEEYAYFDKYMITAASFLYAAYRICDDSVPASELDDCKGMTWQTSDDFHKLFMRGGEYFAQYDYRAESIFDCSGLGRLHKKGAPSELCLSTPCPAKPHYVIDIKKPFPLAVAPGICVNGKWKYAVDEDVIHKIKSHSASGETAQSEIECTFGSKTLVSKYVLDKNGLDVTVSGGEKICCLLPVFKFNGEKYSEVILKENVLEVIFNGYVCRYTVSDGTLRDLKRPARNRNGHYDTFAAEGANSLKIHIEIEKIADAEK